MSFCGQCGLLLTTNTTRCPRCGAEIDPIAVSLETSADESSTTIIKHAEAPGHTSQSGYPLSGSNYTVPGSFVPTYNQASMSGTHQPGVFPVSDPNHSFHPLPPRKTRKWPIFLVSVLIVVLVAATVMFFALGTNSFAGIFDPKSTVQTPAATTQQGVPVSSVTPASSVTPTSSVTPAATSLQLALSTIQQYYDNINNQNYQAAYNLWFNNPDNYAHFKQGFANTQRDDITLGAALSQTDGTIRVNLTVQATQTTTGGGAQLSTYQGYYTVGQQADGSWKIINGSLNPV